jgi:hypothetical protein
LKGQREQKVVMVEAAPSPLPSSLENMMEGGERPPELVFLATIKIFDYGRMAGGDHHGEGCIVEVAPHFVRCGMSDAMAGTFTELEEAMDAAVDLVRNVCRVADEHGIYGTDPGGE